MPASTPSRPDPPVETFAALERLPGVRALFVGRAAGIDVDADRATVLARLDPVHRAALGRAGWDAARLATAEQVHGAEVAVIDGRSAALPARGADALVTSSRGAVLGVYVADCAAVFIADRHARCVGLAHSGREGTRGNIVGRTIRAMTEAFGAPPADLVVQVSPCIRPPCYEVDFAAEIRRQAAEAGAGDIHDDCVCTGCDTLRYYSYRLEKGRTGRMLAAISLVP